MDYQYFYNKEQVEKQREEFFLRGLIKQAQQYNSKASGLIKQVQQHNEQTHVLIRQAIIYELERLDYPIPDDEWLKRAVDYCLSYLTTSSSQSK